MTIRYVCYNCSKTLNVSGFKAVNEIGRKSCDRCGSNDDDLLVVELGAYCKSLRDLDKAEKIMKEIMIVKSKTDPYEYFCPKCLQLRLKLRDDDKCGNCGEPITIKGKMNELDHESLLAKYRG